MSIRFLAPLWLAWCAVACGGEAEQPSVVYVDAAAASGGNGSAERPFQTLREALEVAWPLEMVVVAGGDYGAPDSFGFATPLVIQGSTEAVTRIGAETAGGRLTWQGAGALVVRNLDLIAPLDLSTGSLELQEVGLGEVSGPALSLSGVDARLFDVALTEVIESDGEPGSGDGISVTGGSLEWHRGSASAPDRALLIEGATAELEDLVMTGGDRAPLTVFDGAAVTATGLTVTDTGIAIYARNASLDLDGVEVARAATAGLMVSAGGDVSVTGSSFSDCPQGHVSVMGEDAAIEITDSSFHNATGAGCLFISQTTGQVTFTGNLIDSCAGSGISLAYLTGAVVEDNELWNILPDPIFPDIADAISLIDSQARLAGNYLHDADGAGIALLRSTAEISGNQIGPTGSTAVSIVDPGSDRTAVTDNQISDAVGVGVLVLNSEADISGNEISATAYSAGDGFGDGVAFGQGADVVATGNSSDDNARNGYVFLDGATGSISDNRATGNGQYGILEFCSGDPNEVAVGTNTLTGNTLGEQSLCSSLR